VKSRKNKINLNFFRRFWEFPGLASAFERCGVELGLKALKAGTVRQVIRIKYAF
jgi:hypothetical protein